MTEDRIKEIMNAHIADSADSGVESGWDSARISVLRMHRAELLNEVAVRGQRIHELEVQLQRGNTRSSGIPDEVQVLARAEKTEKRLRRAVQVAKEHMQNKDLLGAYVVLDTVTGRPEWFDQMRFDGEDR